jgi:hypothetical protein
MRLIATAMAKAKSENKTVQKYLEDLENIRGSE